MSTMFRRVGLTLVLLTGLALTLAACGPPPEPVDTGPNAHLSNAELVDQAGTNNMDKLRSYEYVFRGEVAGPPGAVSSTTVLTMTSYGLGKGDRLQFRYDPGTNTGGEDTSPLAGDPFYGRQFDYIQTGAPDWRCYSSFDGGRTWSEPEFSCEAAYGLMEISLLWVMWMPHSVIHPPTPGELSYDGLLYQDGHPRITPLDGVLTRHLVADLRGVPDYLGATQVQIWATSELSPTIRKMQVVGRTSAPESWAGLPEDVAVSRDGQWLAATYGKVVNAVTDDRVLVGDLRRPADPPARLRCEQRGLKSVAFSPDGRWLAAGTDRDGLCLWDLHSATPVATVLPAPAAEEGYRVAFRPDGQMLAAAGSAGIYLWLPPFAGTQPTPLPAARGDDGSTLAFSPDNHTLATVTYQEGVRLYDLRQPAAAPTILPYTYATAVAFSADGQQLAVLDESNDEYTIQLWQLNQEPPTAITLPGGSKHGGTVALSRDGRFLAANDDKGRVRLWDLAAPASGAAVRTPVVVLALPYWTSALAFTPDGKRLVTTNDDGAVRLWDVSALLAAARSGPAGPAPAPQVLMDDPRDTGRPFVYTWHWSRINEDLGVVELPPPETIKSP